jgi:lysozyme family protein
VNDPDDPGGATNKGITLRTLGACANLLGIQPTVENLKALTNEQARTIYKALYWDKIQGDRIDMQELANIVFDFYVNAGTNATKLLQSVLNDMGANPALPVDGVIGPVTLQAIARADQKELYRRYKQGRMDYYRDLAADHPSLGKFLRGWLNRVNAFPDL